MHAVSYYGALRVVCTYAVYRRLGAVRSSGRNAAHGHFDAVPAGGGTALERHLTRALNSLDYCTLLVSAETHKVGEGEERKVNASLEGL